MMIVGLTLVFVCVYTRALFLFHSFIHSADPNIYKTHLKRQVVNILHKCFSCDEPSYTCILYNSVCLCAKMKPKKAIKITENRMERMSRDERVREKKTHIIKYPLPCRS